MRWSWRGSRRLYFVRLMSKLGTGLVLMAGAAVVVPAALAVVPAGSIIWPMRAATTDNVRSILNETLGIRLVGIFSFSLLFLGRIK